MWQPGTLVRAREGWRYRVMHQRSTRVNDMCLVIANRTLKYGTLGWTWEIACLVDGRDVTDQSLLRRH